MGTYRQTPTLGFSGFFLTPAVKTLIIINALLFIVPELFRFPLHRALLLGLWPGLVVKGAIWQVFTYMFFHGGFYHLLFNMLTLWMFGTLIEQTWGTRRFAIYYLGCGMAAGVCVTLMTVIFGSQQAMMIPTIGSSGAVFGLILALGMLFPDMPVLFMFVFPMPAKYFAMLMGFIELFLETAQPGSSISHVAHLGGMAYGYLYIRFYHRRRTFAGYAGRFGNPRAPSSRRFFPDLQGLYKRWKLRRARKKFEVYMRKREQQDREGPNRWVQ